jgi:hypothetical protein
MRVFDVARARRLLDKGDGMAGRRFRVASEAARYPVQLASQGSTNSSRP